MTAWSPDGQWLAYARSKGGVAWEIVKIKPGSSGGSPIILDPALQRHHRTSIYSRMQWSPAGDWILYSWQGLSLISPDGQRSRDLPTHEFATSGFSKDGSEVLGIYRNTNPQGSEWQLYSVDVKSGAEKFLGAVDLPPATEAIAGFSLHPDGKSFLTSIAKWPYDIWMLEGFDQHKSWLDRLLRR